MRDHHEPDVRQKSSLPIFLLNDICPKLGDDSDNGSLFWQQLVNLLTNWNDEQLIVAAVQIGGGQASFISHNVSRDQIIALVGNLKDGALLLLPPDMEQEIFEAAVESLPPGVTLLLHPLTSGAIVHAVTGKMPKNTRLALYPIMDENKIRMIFTWLLAASTGAKLLLPPQTPARVMEILDDILYKDSLQLLDRRTSPDIFIKILSNSPISHTIPDDMTENTIVQIAATFPVGSKLTLPGTTPEAKVIAFAKNLKVARILQFEQDIPIKIMEIAAKNMPKGTILYLKNVTSNMMKIAAGALNEGTTLRVDTNIDVESAHEIALLLKPNVIIYLIEIPSEPLMVSIASGLHDGAILTLPTSTPNEMIARGIMSLGHGACFLCDLSWGESTILAATNANNQNKKAILAFNPIISKKLICLAASNSRDGASISLPSIARKDIIQHAAAHMGNGARLILTREMTIDKVHRAAFYMGAGATLVLEQGSSMENFVEAAEALNMHAGLSLDANTPLEIVAAVAKHMRAGRSLLLPQTASKEMIQTAAANAEGGVTLLLHPGIPESHFIDAARALYAGAILVLPPDISISTLVEIAKSIPAGAVLYLHQDTPRDNVIIAAAVLNKGAKIILPPETPINIVNDAMSKSSAGSIVHASSLTPQSINETSIATSPLNLLAAVSEMRQVQEMVIEPPTEIAQPPEIEQPTEVLQEPNDNSLIYISDQTKVDIWAESHGFEYMHPTKQDADFKTIESHLFFHKVPLLGNEVKMFGVFTQSKINKNAILGEYKGEVTTLNGDRNLDYVYRLPKNKIIDAAKKRNWTAMVNSSTSATTANVTSFENRGHIFYQATRDIQPDEQLLIYYGDDYKFDKQFHRFIRTTDSWLESNEILTKYTTSYDHEGVRLPHGFDLLFGIHPNTKFIIPKITPDMKHPDLPLLAINETTEQPELQCSQENITLLMYHCWQGDLESVRHLLKRGANPDIQTSISGISALHLVIHTPIDLEPKKLLIEALLNNGATLEIQDRNNQSILHWAIKTQEIILIRHLVENVDQKNSLCHLIDDNNDDPFLFALKYGVPEIVNYLKAKIIPEDVKFFMKEHELTETLRSFVNKYSDKNKDQVLLDILQYLLGSQSKKRKNDEHTDIPTHLWLKMKIDDALDALADIQKDYQRPQSSPRFFSHPTLPEESSSSSDTHTLGNKKR